MVWEFNLPHPTLAPFFQVKKLDFYCVPFLPVERVFDSTDPPLKLPPFAKSMYSFAFQLDQLAHEADTLLCCNFSTWWVSLSHITLELTPCPTLPLVALVLNPEPLQVLLFRFPASSRHACQHQHDDKRGTRK